MPFSRFTMEEQEWRKSARRHGTLRTNHAQSGSEVLRANSRDPGLSTRAAVSANKTVGRKNEPIQNGAKAPIAAPSRWKGMRQAVRIKATIDTEHRRSTSARIADLCDEDREKVAKLVRRIVEVSALHEDSEKEYERQRSLMVSEIQELRGHAKRDSREIEDLSEKLKAALEKLRDYQERVLVLEESNEAEVRHRMETDQTMDLLKIEVDKLRKLVKKQKHEMEVKESDQHRKHREEMERIAQELKETHELLLRERRERLEEKQRALDERIERSTPPPAATTAPTVATNRYDPPRPETGTLPAPLDLSALLNSSADLPDKIKEIMNEWKTRMEDALNATAASIREESTGLKVSTACQTDGDRVEYRNNTALDTSVSTDRAVLKMRAMRSSFDRLSVVEDTGVTSREDPAVSSGYAHSRLSRHPHDSNAQSPRTRTDLDARSVTRSLLPDFTNASAFVEADLFEDEVESTIALIDGLQSSPDRPGGRPSSHQRNLSLFDSSVLGVVDVMESSGSPVQFNASTKSTPSSTNLRTEEDSPSTKVKRLVQGLEAREQKLARVSALQRPREPSFLHDVELFNEVKDVYEEHLQETRRGLVDADSDHYDDYDDHEELSHYDEFSPASSPRSLSVQEAIERDMQDLLRSEDLRNLHR